jgi:3D (Asp-Asp-Asp) domain-containing protein
MGIRVLLFAAVLAAAASADAADGTKQGELHLRATLYYTALQQDYPAGDSAAFLDDQGAVLRRGSSEFHAAAATEGTARFADGEVLNLTGGGDTQWQRTEASYGLSTNGCQLVPFRSAAVDPNLIPLGSRLLIPETAGIPLPDGTAHDGVWLATDTGPDISGNRIDLFTGAGYASMTYMEEVGVKTNHVVTVWVLGTARGCEFGR